MQNCYIHRYTYNTVNFSPLSCSKTYAWFFLCKTITKRTLHYFCIRTLGNNQHKWETLYHTSIFYKKVIIKVSRLHGMCFRRRQLNITRYCFHNQDAVIQLRPRLREQVENEYIGCVLQQCHSKRDSFRIRVTIYSLFSRRVVISPSGITHNKFSFKST